jgi:hypothetical protein
MPEFWPRLSPVFTRARDTVRSVGPGYAASFLLHLTALLLVLFVFMKSSQTPAPMRVVPVDLVIRLAEETTSPPAEQKSIKPVQPAMRSQKREESNPRAPEGTSRTGTRPLPLDNLDAKLRDLAHLRQPRSDLPALDNSGTADIAAESPGAASGEAAYSIRDFVRATVERKWNLDFGKLGRRQYVIPLRIVMRRDGNIVNVEIVDRARYSSDAVYRSVSLSARNAVLLSSPISLPPGEYSDVMDMTLVFNPRDMRR